MMDVADIVGELQYVGENGLAHPDILAVDIAAEITTDRNAAAIFDVNVKGGLRTGNNTATVSLFEFGNPATQTVDVPFTIPSGVPLTGRLTASGPGGFVTNEDSYEQDAYFEQPTSVIVDRRTVAEAVDDLENELPNNSLVISYKPLDTVSEADPEAAAPKDYAPIEVDKQVDWFVTGGSVKSAPQIRLTPSSATVKYGGWVDVLGGLLGVYETSEVECRSSRRAPALRCPSRLECQPDVRVVQLLLA